MEYLKDWLKTILYMNVLLLVCDSLIRNTKYENYLRFFSGFLMMLCLVKPLIDVAGAGQYMDASYILNQMKNEWHIIEESEDLSKMKKRHPGRIRADDTEAGEKTRRFFFSLRRRKSGFAGRVKEMP